MSPLLYDLPIIKHYDFVSVYYGTESMGYCHSRNPSRNSLNRLLHFLLTFCVQSRGRLIQKQHLWLVENRPGYSYSLFLTS